MVFKFTKPNLEEFPVSTNKKYFYADFNVLNYLYENKTKIPDSISLYPDSTAVHMILRLKKNKISSKLVSTDFQEELLEKADQLKLKTFFLGDEDSVLNKLRLKISDKYSDLIISGSNSGYNFDTENVINSINYLQPDILFVGLGVGRQEPWIIENANKIDVPLILSVGGWFKFLAGTKKRAPLVLRKLHLEWLFKIITDFKRLWKRYLFGIPKFYYRVFTGKIHFELLEP